VKVYSIPGISRSGATITLGRHFGLSPEKAAEFSLLMSVPVLLGAAIIKTTHLIGAENGDLTILNLAVGGIVSAVVGYFSIIYLVKTLSAGRFWCFGVYCLMTGITGIIFI